MNMNLLIIGLICIVSILLGILAIYKFKNKWFIANKKKLGAIVSTAIILSTGVVLYPLGDQPLSGDTIYEITSGSGNWEVPTGVTSIDILVVAGGGGSGCGITDTNRNGGGGGAGGLIWIENVTKLGDVYIEPGNEIAYSIGAGGATAVNQGSLGSTGSDTTFGNLTAKGGGGGGSVDTRDGVDGGSGGGAGSRSAAYGTGGDEIQTSQSGWSGTSGFGNDGADGAANTAGGGGGANAAGSGTTGGAGKDMSSYVGTDYGVSGVYSKGGNAHSDAANGAANSGNGGNAAATDGTTGGNGGSGIVVLRYTAAQAAPTITSINFAGSLGEKGGPYWRPKGETVQLTDAWENGYYTNSSYQSNDWIYINCTIENASTVYLNWLNGTTWTNWTYTFTDRASNYWDINTSGTIKTCAGYNYSFNVVANSTGGSATMQWLKTGSGGSDTRRYVQLNHSAINISYKVLYLYDAEYPVASVNKYDRLKQDQGTDGTIEDTGYFMRTVPTATVQERNCTGFTCYQFGDSVCVYDISISNIYYHIFWATSDDDLKVGCTKTRQYINAQAGEMFVTDSTESRLLSGTIYYDGSFAHKNYSLLTHLQTLATPISVTKNDIYEFGTFYRLITLSNNYPSTISNRSFTSFILLNVPSNATLNSTDWSGTGGDVGDYDGDGLSCWEELYVHYTNPFLADTDNDGVNDYDEVQAETDPNDYTDYPTYYEQTIRNTGVDYFVWLGSNVSAWHVAQEIVNFDEVTESISVWKATSWGDDGLWQSYTGTGTGTNWSINTFDIVRVILTDDGTQVISMTNNPDINYSNAREVTLTYGVNLGGNYVGWTSDASITAYDIANTNISTILDDWEQIWHWNRTTYSWSYYIVGFIEPTIWVHEDDVLFIRVENSETLNIGGK